MQSCATCHLSRAGRSRFSFSRCADAAEGTKRRPVRSAHGFRHEDPTILAPIFLSGEFEAKFASVLIRLLKVVIAGRLAISAPGKYIDETSADELRKRCKNSRMI
jgi:hypothetical protein